MLPASIRRILGRRRRSTFKFLPSQGTEEFLIPCDEIAHGCGSLSPRHGASSGCGWRNGLLYGGQLWINWISSRGQPTRGGPPAWGLGEVLTTPLRKKHTLRITHKLRCFLWRQNNGRIILRWIFRKLEGVVGTGWSWLRIGTGGGHLCVRWGTFGFHKRGEYLD